MEQAWDAFEDLDSSSSSDDEHVLPHRAAEALPLIEL